MPLPSAFTAAGDVSEIGQGPGTGTTLNIPLPPGSGRGAYRAVFDRVVTPALDMFEPQLVLVSAGGCAVDVSAGICWLLLLL
jgi:acetoin utilization deacetylase AcuC-like enzyme